jgi:hypothetical protein
MATIHNPTNFNPADYNVEDYLDNRRPEYMGQDLETWKEEIAFWEADMARALGADWRKKSHRCVHCGNGSVRYITAVLHIPTNDVVVFGADCTARLGFADRKQFKLAQIKAKAEAGHARMKVWQAREAFVDARPALKAAIAQAATPAHAKNTFVKDVIGKLNTYGSLSDKQVAAVIASLARDVQKATEPAEVKGDAPTGRTTVTGLVVAVKTYESAYGCTDKMTVKLANNARVWVTVPASAAVDKWDTVTVTATWTASDTDKSFAFGKRPIVSQVVKPEPPKATTDNPVDVPAATRAAEFGKAAIEGLASPDWTVDLVASVARLAGHDGLKALGTW